MPSLRPLPYRKVLKTLEEHGFVPVRHCGSHIILQRRDDRTGTVTVVVPEHSDIPVGTLRSIIRQSRLPKSLFETG